MRREGTEIVCVVSDIALEVLVGRERDGLGGGAWRWMNGKLGRER